MSPALVVAALLLAQAWLSVRGRPRSTRTVVLAMVGWLLWIGFRQGFVRHDLFHNLFFFVVVAVMSVTLMAIARQRSAIGLGILTCALPVLVLTVIGVDLGGLLGRGDSLAAAGRAWSAVTDARAADDVWQAGLQRSADTYALPASLVEEMGTLPTTVDPLQVSALAATDATWDPLPVFQLYAAYTPALDDLNARSIEDRPRQILRADPPVAIDERNPYWESPRYQAAVYCGYDPVSVTEHWLLLRPAAAGRCGAPHDPLTVEAVPGVPVDVPTRPGAITLASVTYHQSITDTLANLLFKAPPRFVSYGGTWRMPFVPQARDLMLNAPVAHAAFPGLPLTPYPSLTLDAPATVEFSFVDVTDTARTLSPRRDAPRIVPWATTDSVARIVVRESGRQRRGSLTA